MASDWIDAGDLSRRVWLHRLGDPAPLSLLEPPYEARWRTMAWLVHPLVAFGLLEARATGPNWSHGPKMLLPARY